MLRVDRISNLFSEKVWVARAGRSGKREPRAFLRAICSLRPIRALGIITAFFNLLDYRSTSSLYRVSSSIS